MDVSGMGRTTVSDYVTKAEESNRELGSYNKSTLDMTDFLKLMATQLANQDMTNPMSNSEMMEQLSQMTSIQTMNDLKDTINNMNDISITNYAASLVGKEVTIADENTDGSLKLVEGKIEGTGLYQGQTVIFVDGKAYALSSIMAVGKIPDEFIEENQPEDGEGSEGTGGTEGSEGSEGTGGTEGSEGSEGTGGTEGSEGSEGTGGTEGSEGSEGTGDGSSDSEGTDSSEDTTA